MWPKGRETKGGHDQEVERRGEKNLTKFDEMDSRISARPGNLVNFSSILNFVCAQFCLCVSDFDFLSEISRFLGRVTE